MTIYPIELQRTHSQVVRIVWNDGLVQELSARTLRDHCPCASCREKHGAVSQAPSILPILTPAESRPLHVESMRPVGNYAYAITFTDGHKNGIYTFELLRQIGADTKSSSNRETARDEHSP
jgi:DUF971 family protein